MEVRAELPVFLANLSELGGDGVELGGDGYSARDGGTEDGEDGAFTSGDGLKRVRGEILDQVGVQLKAVPGFHEDICQEDKEGRWLG